jgi:hypothetical protein
VSTCFAYDIEEHFISYSPLGFTKGDPMTTLLTRGINKLQRLTGMGEAFPGEIKYDRFYQCIERMARESNVKTILEIGSSAGGGSTEAFVKGIRQNPSSPTLFCMEVAPDRFAQLQNRYPDPFVKCYNASSVPVDRFATEQEVREFCRVMHGLPGAYDVEIVLSWLQGEQRFLTQKSLPDDGIALIKRENGIDMFDMVLIDGSEFTGRAEFDEVVGCRYILLDDILVLKNHYNCQRLVADARYKLVEVDTGLRNGFAVFERL